MAQRQLRWGCVANGVTSPPPYTECPVRAPGMPTSPSSPEDRFQREIDDIVRLAEKRLERKGGLGARARRGSRRLGRALSSSAPRLPPVEQLAGWGLALLLLSWLLSLLRFLPGAGLLGFVAQVLGIALLTLAIVLSLTRGRGGGGGGGKMWRGERITYGNPYGQSGLLRRLRRLFGGK